MPYTTLRAPMLANLRMDPFERTRDEGIGYPEWWVDHLFVFAPRRRCCVCGGHLGVPDGTL